MAKQAQLIKDQPLKNSKVRDKLTNGYVEALRDFRPEDETVIRWDTQSRPGGLPVTPTDRVHFGQTTG